MTDAGAPLAIVLGVRSNVPAPSLPPVATTLENAAAKAGRRISIIVIEGQPKITSLPLFSSNAGNPAAFNQDLQKYVGYYFPSSLAADYHAQVGEANVLKALDMAANAVGPGGNIIVVDSGLQTVAPLEYQQPGVLMSPPKDLVTSLRQRKFLPPMSGRHVLLSGFGWTAAPQPSLDQPQQASLVGQWEAIIKAGGGCATVDSQPTTTAAVPGLPPVSVVKPPQPPVFSACGTTQLEDWGSVGFNVGKYTFRNVSAARATLAQLAAKLKRSSVPITLIGSTSTEGGPAVNDPLSWNRANAVKKLLVSLGIDGSRIAVKGDGARWPGRVRDVSPTGVLLPGPAEQDREVIVQLPPCTS